MNRMDKLSPFLVMDILREAKGMPDAVHLEIGEQDLPPPPAVYEYLEKALRERTVPYTPALGLPELREKIAEHYFHTYGVEVAPERIAVTPGTSGAFLVAYALTLNAGDRIALADPGYPCYKNFAHLLDIVPEFVPVSKATAYEIRPEMLEGRSGVRAVHLSSPANPTGNLYAEETLRTLAEHCEAEQIRLLSDEIYHGLVYEGRERTALEFSDRALVINGFSKAFCMPGFRLGWLIVPPDLVRQAEIVIQNVFISAPTLSQYAALGAFDAPYLKGVRETFRERRDALCDGLQGLVGIDAKPQGAFYVWADVGQYAQDADAFARRLLREARVAVAPGVDFGSHRTGHFIRLAYTRDLDTLREGIKRIREFLQHTARPSFGGRGA